MDSSSDSNPLSDNEVSEIEDDALDLLSMKNGDEAIDYGNIEEVVNSTKATSPKRYFTILSESDIKRLQDVDINDVLSVLSISRAAACLLLYHYEWCVPRVIEAWFDNEEKVRKAIGLLKHPQIEFSRLEILMCEICFETISSDKMKSTDQCGHPFCIKCWEQYMDAKIDEGPHKCLTLRCPKPSCDAAVDEDMVHKVASESSKNKYDMFLFRSYVDKNKKIKWCPAPACEYAVSYEAIGYGKQHYDVTCICYHSFCWNCGEEAHRPVDCKTVNQWIKKNTESKNTSWILSYTKPCPDCKIPIEKGYGCTHMTCICGFQFCWLCLRAWPNCNSEDCNRFMGIEFVQAGTEVQQGIIEIDNEEEMKRKKANNYLERYTYCYERWANNEFSRKNALQNLIDLSTMHIKRLSVSHEKSEIDFNFIKDAWLQVVECRRVLKWTYVYGYYLPKNNKAKLTFFEYIKGEAEAALERLHHHTENELGKFLNVGPGDEFNAFRVNLINLTMVTKNYFKNLVKAIENGLDDDVHVKNYVGIKRGSIRDTGESSSYQRENRRTM